MDSLTATPTTPRWVDEPSLPFRFRVPMGWPAPSPDWLAANQAWEPPAGWTPAAGLPAAPAAWLFWERHESGWLRFASRFRRQHVWGAIIDLVLLAGGILLLGTHDGDHGIACMMLWGAMIFAPIDLSCHVGQLFRMRVSIVHLARATSARIGPELDATSYAECGSPDRGAFLADRLRDAWSHASEWPADQIHEVDFRPQRSPLPLGLRLATMALSGALGALLILVVAWSTSGVPTGAL